jgi:hypothetical protein
MAGLRSVRFTCPASPHVPRIPSPLLTDVLLGARRVFIVGVRTPSHVGQPGSIAGAVDAKAGIVGEAIISGTAARLMPKGIVAAWDEAAIQLFPGRGIASAIANEYARVAHRHMFSNGQGNAATKVLVENPVAYRGSR